MSHIVFVLGAGASKHAGAPLMAEFLDVAAQQFAAVPSDPAHAHYHRVSRAISALQSVHSKSQLDLINLESVFTALEVANTLKKLPGFAAEEIPETITSLKELIVKTLEATMKFPISEHRVRAPDEYATFATLISNITSSRSNDTAGIISFNYDVGVDIALSQQRVAYDYGLEKSHDQGPRLLKLHGSLNWGISLENESIHPIHMDKYLRKHGTRLASRDPHTLAIVQVGTHLGEYLAIEEGVRVAKEPVIVPPAWNKADYHQMLRNVWQTAAGELEKADHIFIMGYSMPETDAFFRLLYALGTAGQTPLREITVFNPDKSGTTEERFRSLMGPGALARFSYQPIRFENALYDLLERYPSPR